MESYSKDLPIKIRIKDIAKQANVSVGTVDRVLHNRGEVSPETRALVNKIISDFSYEPNPIASALASKKPFQIALLLPSPKGYWGLYKNGLEAVKKEIAYLGGAVLPFYIDLNDPNTLAEQCERIKQVKPDALLAFPFHSLEYEALKITFKTKGLPVIELGILEAAEGEKRNGAFQSGYLAAKLMHYGMSKETTVLIVRMHSDTLSDEQSQQRILGFKAFLSDNAITETKIRVIEAKNAEEEEVKRVLTNAFSDYSFIRGLFVANAEVYRVAKFVEEKKLGNIRVIGFEPLEENLAYLKKGVIDFLISQNPENQLYTAVKELFYCNYLKQSFQNKRRLPIEIITKENLESFLS